MPFEKGQSGNPGGRPKETKDVRELARKHSQEAIEKLVHWMREGDAKSSSAAAQALLDRAWGRPHQAHEHSGPDGDAIEARIKLSFE